MAQDDFDVESLANYLHLSPGQIVRLADRGRLPGRKIAGQWRFSHAEVHHWLEDRIGASDDDSLARVEGVLERADRPSGVQPVRLVELLPREAIAVPLAARTRNSVITAMVGLAAQTGLLWDVEKMAEAVRQRENLHPTALDNGVAMLHPRRPMASILAGPVLAFGRTHGGIPFGGQCGELTDVFFLICSTEDRGHLRILARLSRLISNASFLAHLRETEDPDLVRQLIAENEAKLEE
jgi:PTS system nitrogen regulatory IIA component